MDPDDRADVISCLYRGSGFFRDHDTATTPQAPVPSGARFETSVARFAELVELGYEIEHAHDDSDSDEASLGMFDPADTDDDTEEDA